MAITDSFSFAGSRTDRIAGAKGVFARIGERMIASRKRRADRAVASYLLSLDDATLTRLGYDRAELQAKNPLGYPFI